MSRPRNIEHSSTPRRFKPYPRYKDSGVEWLGKIPNQWEVRRIKRMCLVRRGASPRPIDDPAYFDDDGEYAWVRIADVTASDRFLTKTTQRLSNLGKSKSVALEPGQIFLSIAATVGAPIITKIKCCIHDGFVYFTGLRANHDFLYYAFLCGEAYKGLGKQGTQLNLNTDTIGDISLPLPSAQDQERIAAFLDRETARIDALVAKKERLIELLQEKRSALITRAVTRGLDPSVPMKDSGIDWLGTIPAHWELRRMGDVAVSLQTGPFGSQLHANEYITGGWPVINPANLQDGELIADCEITVDDTTANRLGLHRLVNHDILFARRGEVGRCGLATESQSGWICGTGCLRLRANLEVVDPRFMMRFLSMSVVGEWLRLQSVGATMQNLNSSIIGRIPVVVPRLSEQKAVAVFLDAEVTKTARLMNEIRKVIERLKEFRAALISAAVTGKIDVRGLVA